ncbi:MAG: response regulator [Alcanivoracaceae bacterium]|nr:response regulator [Alcanivoracaceae bacterium]
MAAIKFVIIICLIVSKVAFVKEYYAEDYVDIGIPVTNIHKTSSFQNFCLLQTDNGLIYVGTHFGISAWDGENWTNYETPEATRVRSMTQWDDDKIYVGTTNDIGYFSVNENSSLKFTSLIEDWAFEKRQFGEIWSTTANSKGVLFAAVNDMFFWNGKEIKNLSHGLKSVYKVFEYDDAFIFKNTDEAFFHTIQVEPELKIKKTQWQLPEGSKIRQMLYNQDKKLTIFTSKLGVYELNEGVFVKKIDGGDFPQGTDLYNAIQASDGYYYLSSLNQGLFIASKELKLLKNYTDEHNLGINSFTDALEDKQGNIWFSGVPNIVKMIPPHIFSTYTTEKKSNRSSIIAIFKNKPTVAGYNIHQLQNGENSLAPSYFKALSPISDNIHSFVEYKNHLVSIGDKGIYAQLIGTDQQLGFEKIVELNLYGRFVAVDPVSDTLFATTHEGLYRITQQSGQWQSELIPGLFDELENIEISDNGIIWVGSESQELYRIENAQYDDKETLIQKFTGADGLGPYNVIPFKLSFGMVFGTYNGLMDFKLDRQPQLQLITDLPEIFHTPGKDVYRIYEDDEGRLWFRIKFETGFAEKNPDGHWRVNSRIFKPFPNSGYRGFVKTAPNIIWITMSRGEIFRINTDLIQNIPNQGQLNIRLVSNLDTEEEIYGGLNTPLLPLLDQQHNSIRINYALTENVIQRAKKYRHRLLGSNYENWSNWSGDETYKDFTLLRGNDYQFQVEAQDGWDRISSAEMSFTVAPFWYLSRIAWITYAVFLGLLLLITAWLSQKWRSKKLKLRNAELEQQVEERTAEVQYKALKLEQKTKELEQQHVLKDRFFTNVSHEFRTPLTLTIAPLKSFIDDNPNLDKSMLHPIETALRNSKKMLSLVGQVLDINRLESGRFPLRVAQYDVTDLINSCIKRFKSWAQQHKQTLSVSNVGGPLLLYFDLDQLEKCLSNLLSNAIKYSGEGSQIKISLNRNNHHVGIKVSDNGRGISLDFEDKIFQRYTQDETSEHISEPGTGIGLALVKELIELHYGRIELINKPEEGCSFILWIKVGHAHFSSEQLIEPIGLENNDDFKYVPSQMPKPIIDDNDNEDITTILVVDDSAELREFIVSRLSSYYRILQAGDGQEGFAMAQTKLPDLIISDVMMPVMDGFEMTKKLKSSETSKHIPIILLTAKTSKRETVEGLGVGADDYLTKPFDTSELIVRVKGMIDRRKKIREEIKLELSNQLSSVKKISSFIDKLHTEIISQLSNPKLNIESLSSALAMSRSSLNRKCHEKLDKSPMQYITEIRMQHALILLKNKKHSVSDTAYGIGYESLAYFSRVFKKHYGQSPSSSQKQQ